VHRRRAPAARRLQRNLRTDDLNVARAIASRVRERGGGLPKLKALGFALASRGVVQVSRT
jgi:glutamate formiminotransferase